MTTSASENPRNVKRVHEVSKYFHPSIYSELKSTNKYFHILLLKKYYTNYIRCSGSMQPVPDVVCESRIWVHGADPSHCAGRWAVLRYIHSVTCPWETRGLICIQHGHSDQSTVFKGPTPKEPRVHDGVQNLHWERVRAAALIVHRL